MVVVGFVGFVVLVAVLVAAAVVVAVADVESKASSWWLVAVEVEAPAATGESTLFVVETPRSSLPTPTTTPTTLVVVVAALVIVVNRR